MKALILIVISLFLFAGAYADTATGRVGITTAAPNITINNPIANSWYNSSFLINASIGGTTTAATYRYENTTTNGSYTSLTHQGSGIWTKTFNISTVANGNYTIRVNASNEANTTDVKTVFIYIDDTNPVISSFTLTKTSTIYVGDTLASSDFSCSATDNSESFGGSISKVITGISTSTAGTKTATCTVTDSANYTATATVSYTVTSSGGGGSGSSGNEIRSNKTNATNATAKALLEQVPAERTIRLTGFPKPILAIEVDTAQTITNSDIQVSILSSAEPVSGANVFSYAEISSTAPEDAIKSARIIFEVDKSWLAKNNPSPDSIILYRLAGGAWSALSTDRTGETADTYTYTAATPGFSTFAIAAAAIPKQEAITGAATSVPVAAVPLSTNIWVLLLLGGVFVAMIFLARRNKKMAGKRHR